MDDARRDGCRTGNFECVENFRGRSASVGAMHEMIERRLRRSDEVVQQQGTSAFHIVTTASHNRPNFVPLFYSEGALT